MNATRDKHGREMKVGDVLKVYHFTGPRRKRYFMYKQIVGLRQFGGHDGVNRFVVSHLNFRDGENYTIGMNEGVIEDCEIVQGLDDFYARPKATKQ